MGGGVISGVMGGNERHDFIVSINYKTFLILSVLYILVQEIMHFNFITKELVFVKLLSMQ